MKKQISRFYSRQAPRLRSGLKGFTLIELLVVIAIIGLLSTLAVVSLNSARSKARDARRTSDIRQLQTGLDMYYNDNGKYPIYIAGDTFDIGQTDSDVLSTGVAAGFAAAGTGTTLMAQVPTDPQDTQKYYYKSDTTGTTYELRFVLENANSSWGCVASATCFAIPGSISSTDPGL